MPEPPAFGNASDNQMLGTPARARAEHIIEKLRQRGGVFVEAVRATRVAMAITDPRLPGNPIVFANNSLLELSGYRMDEVLGQQPFFMNGADTDAKDAQRFRRALEQDHDVVLDTVQYRKDGSRFVATVLLSAFKDEGGRTINHFLSWADATSRVDAEDEASALRSAQAALRESERHANVLLAELQHRVRNTLAVVRSIARRTADTSVSAEDMLDHFQGRLDAFARVQSALTRSPLGRVDLRSLIEDELVAHAFHQGRQIHIGGPDTVLVPRTAERLSLAVHELTTNAVKHGALVNGEGRIRIGWTKQPSARGDELVFEWTESGVKLDARKKRREGFGMDLLRRSLPYELDAETNVDMAPTGLRFVLKMPFPPPAPPK